MPHHVGHLVYLLQQVYTSGVRHHPENWLAGTTTANGAADTKGLARTRSNQLSGSWPDPASKRNSKRGVKLYHVAILGQNPPKSAKISWCGKHESVQRGCQLPSWRYANACLMRGAGWVEKRCWLPPPLAGGGGDRGWSRWRAAGPGLVGTPKTGKKKAF